MKRLLLAALLLAAPAAAEARSHHYHGGGGIMTVQTAIGPITVASHLAGRFQSLINDLAFHGYRPRHVSCYARYGHVKHSRHHVGAACDIDQRGWNRTSSFMYHAHTIITRHGFRDGCSFHDCGHVDDGMIGHRRHYTKYRAHRHYRVYRYWW